MRKFLVLAISITLILSSCSNDEAKKELTFADIEQEFNFKKPLTDLSKKFILERFGSIEDYRNFLISTKFQTRDESYNADKSVYLEKILSTQLNEQYPNLNNTYASALSYFTKNGSKATYDVYLWHPASPTCADIIKNCPDYMFILDAAEEVGILDLPYSCRGGACTTCVGKLRSGTIDQSEQSILDDDQMRAGFMVTCVAYATSEIVIETHAEEQLY